MVEIWVYLNLNENSIEIHVGKDLPTKPPLGFTIKFLLSGLRHGPNYLRPVTDFWHNNHNSPYLEWIEIEKVTPSTILGQSPLTIWGLTKNVFLQNHPGWRFSSADLEIRSKIVFLTKGKRKTTFGPTTSSELMEPACEVTHFHPWYQVMLGSFMVASWLLMLGMLSLHYRVHPVSRNISPMKSFQTRELCFLKCFQMI